MKLSRRIGLVVLLTSACLLLSRLTQIPETPEDWILYAGFPEPESPTRLCADRMLDSWVVAIRDGRVTANAEYVSLYDERDFLPYEIDYSTVFPVLTTRDQQWLERLESDIQRIVAKVQNGWLVGFNLYGWGGSLWWYPIAEGAGRKLWDDNVVAITRRRGAEKFYVFTGWGDIRQGSVLSAEQSDTGEWVAREIASISDVPLAHVIDDDDGILIATPTTVESVSQHGEVEVLAKPEYLGKFPNSLVRAPSGSIYVGLHFFVLRLRRVDNVYEQDWLVPGACSSFHWEEFFCVCDGVQSGV